MKCNCEDIYPDSDMTRWESCPSSIIEDADNYYTKHQVDELISGASGCCITEEEVDEKIEEAVSGKQDTLIAGSGITISGNVISADGADLSNYYTKSETSGKTEIANALNALDNKKLDASAYTPTDLSNYYTKSETSGKTELSTAFNSKQDKLIAGANITISGNVISAAGGSEPIIIDPTLSSGSSNPVANSAITNALDGKLDVTAYTPTDLTNYYTKTESDGRYQPKGNYATEAWVEGKGYVTNVTVLQYITNLQNQIDSLSARLEECCSQTGETLYRWVTMTGASDYVCSGTTKMSKEAEEQSTDGGVTWTRTGNYRTGSTVLEYNSEDCGYVPPMKFKGVLLNHNTINIPCNSSSVLSSAETYTTNAYTSIEIGNCVTIIGNDAFSNQVYLSGSLTLPNSVITIGDSAFSKCDGLSALTLNNGLQTIGEKSFTYCTGFTSIVIPDTVTSIGLQAFYLHRASTIIIGSGVTSIGLSAFETNSSNVQSVTVNATTPPIIQDTGTAFTFRGSYPIYVPSASVNAYKTAWSVYASRIQAIP